LLLLLLEWRRRRRGGILKGCLSVLKSQVKLNASLVSTSSSFYYYFYYSRCLKELDGPNSGPVASVTFDLSGQYLAAGGSGVVVWVVKEWNSITSQSAHTEKVTAIKFGYPDASFLATTSLDRTLKFFSAAE